MTDALIDFSRYAPDVKRPTAAPAETDELAQSIEIIKDCCTIIGQCLLIAGSVIAHRTRSFFDRFLRSLHASWTVAGFGWGGFVGLFLIHFL
jgi:hypothetical protein